MLDPKKIAQLDQERASLVEMLPPLWWELYQANIAQGFTPEEAMHLVCLYTAALLNGNGSP